tara:strand:- start:59 stop:481 length:423 start_codon:yes stop_codon:yes gene_type:complete
MDCEIRWLGNETMSFVAETGSGHSFVIDSAIESGGRNLGPRPMETLLSGAITCSIFDIIKYLRESKQNITGCKVSVKAEREDKSPRVFKSIHFHIIISGKYIEEERVRKAIELTKTQLGSGYKTLSMTAEITDSFEILES